MQFKNTIICADSHCSCLCAGETESERLSLSEDSNGDVSPDLPDTDEWSLDVCRTADECLDNRASLRKRPPLKRGRSLEQLLQACQVDDDNDCDNLVSIYL